MSSNERLDSLRLNGKGTALDGGRRIMESSRAVSAAATTVPQKLVATVRSLVNWDCASMSPKEPSKIPER